MKNVLIFCLFLYSFIGFSQNAAVSYKAESLFPELFHMTLPVKIPSIQFVPEKEIYMKEKNLKLEKGGGYRIVFNDKSVYVGSVLDNYGKYSKTVSISYGKIIFSNGDTFVGHFFEGHPVQGIYKYPDGDSAEIVSADREGCCNYKGKSTNVYFTFKNGATLAVKPPKVEYQSPDGTKIHSNLEDDIFLSGYTEYISKEGYSYRGELSKKKPIKKWEIENEKGSFLAIFNLDGITGFIPYSHEGDQIKWGNFYLGQLVNPLHYLAPFTFCISGDCQNGDATIDVKKDTETGTNFVMYGSFNNGNPVGDFTADRVDENGYKYTIIGPIKNYKFHGKCTKAYIDYKIAFSGEYQNGLPQSGNLTVNDKLIEVKAFKDGKYIGKQIFPRRNIYENNSRYYEGEFNRYGQIEGHGTVYFETGHKLASSGWKEGKSSDCSFTTPENYVESDFYCNIPDGVYFRSLGNQRELEYYVNQRAQEEQARQDAAAQQVQSEHQCGQCNGLGVIKIQCPMCKGAGYRKDMVTYDRHTGNTGGLAKCSHCAGTGQYTLMGCSQCGGKGFVQK